MTARLDGRVDDCTTIQWAGRENGRVIVDRRDGHRSAFHSVRLRHSRYFPAFPERAAGEDDWNQVLP